MAMFPILELVPLVIKGFFQAFLQPHFLPLFIIVMVIIAIQYRRMDQMRETFYGVKTGRTRADILTAIGLGLVGGLIGSFLVIFIGLSIFESGLIYLWPVAILLMLINMRMLCFAYAGGILALSHLLFGFPQISVPQIMALVAILHLVESFLILASGHLGAVPAFIKGAGGRVVGGFTLQKFWPIPLLVLIVLTGEVPLDSGVRMPDWWPLIKPVLPGEPENIAYVMLPVVAGLGYGDLAMARNPVEKSRRSAFFLGLYSLILLVLAVLAGQSYWLALAAALFSPLGHEAVIHIGRQSEQKGKPLYVQPERGVRVLDVLPDSPAWRAGLRSGDVILAVNGFRVNSRADFQHWLLQAPLQALEVYYQSRSGKTHRSGHLHPPPHGGPFGIVPAPEGNEQVYVEFTTTGPLGRWLLNLWNRLKP